MKIAILGFNALLTMSLESNEFMNLFLQVFFININIEARIILLKESVLHLITSHSYIPEPDRTNKPRKYSR